MSSERILAEVHPAMFRANPLGFLLSLLLIPVGVGIIILVVWYIRTRTIKLVLTDWRVEVTRGLLSKHTNEVRYRDIRNFQVRQSFFNRLFGVGRVQISSAGQDDIEVDVGGVPSPYDLKDLIDAQRREHQA